MTDRGLPIIPICAAPRTGTELLCHILTGFPNLKTHTEVFARDYAYSLSTPEIKSLIDITGCIVPTRTMNRVPPQGSATVTQLVYDEPMATLMALMDTAKPHHTALSVKLFGYHLPRAVTSPLFAKPYVFPIVLKRRKIDSYASKLKAQRLQKWINVDTTRLKVEGDIRDYAYWNARHGDWYDYLGAMDLPTLTYPELLADDIAGKIASFVPSIDLGQWQKPSEKYHRQDRNDDPGDKFSNWDEFQAELEKYDLLEDAMGYF